MTKYLKKVENDDNLKSSNQVLVPYRKKLWLPKKSWLLMLVFGVIIPGFLFFCMASIGFIYLDINLHSPVNNLDDVYQTCRYGILFASACLVLLLGSFRLLCPNVWYALKIWLPQGRKLRNSPRSLRECAYVVLFFGLAVALGAAPLAVNEYYATATPVGFHAVVIEKKFTMSYSGRHGGTKHYSVKIHSESGVDSDIGSLRGLYDKLEKHDHLYIQTCQGLLGINFYYAVYKDGSLIYGR